MFNGKYTSLKRVLENVARDVGYEEELYMDDAREWAVRAMNLIGVNVADEQVVETFSVSNFRLALPTEAKEIISIRSSKTKIVLTLSTDLFHLALKDTDKDLIEEYNAVNVDTVYLPTYSIRNGYLFFNFKEGDVDIVYTKYKLDDNGCLMVPDEDRYLMALEAYIIYKVDSKLYRRGEIPRDVLFKSEQDWLWYVNSAANKMLVPNYDSAENLNRRAQAIIGNPDSHRNGFGSLGRPTIKRF